MLYISYLIHLDSLGWGIKVPRPEQAAPCSWRSHPSCCLAPAGLAACVPALPQQLPVPWLIFDLGLVSQCAGGRS